MYPTTDVMNCAKLQHSPERIKWLIYGHVVGFPKESSGNLDVVRNPLDEVRGILVLDVEHLLVNLLRRHAATEETRRREVPR